jgi:NADP-dependent 3-hydroxy acid dehydrogenase YdfG
MASEKLEGKIALVTGASSGIGLATAKQLLEQGARVIGTSRDKRRLKELKIPFGDQFHAHTLDATDHESCVSIVDRLPADWQELDILVNNAGSDIGGRQNFQDGKLEDWLNTMEVNVNGVIRVTHAVILGMLERGQGDIINIGSTSGLEPVPSTTVYSASKHAINGLSESLRKENENTDIRVMQVLPGMVRTEFAANRFGDTEQGETFYDDFGKWLYPEDIANSVLYLLQQPRHVSIPQLVIVPRPAG